MQAKIRTLITLGSPMLFSMAVIALNAGQLFRGIRWGG